MALPRRKTCCHWNANTNAMDMLVLNPDDIAPGTLDTYGVPTVARLFEETPTAPTFIELDAGSVLVERSDLALPEIYGIPKSRWDEERDGAGDEEMSRCG